jgi:hypothetical protein
MVKLLFSACLTLAAASGPTLAQQISYDTPQSWQTWALPTGAIEVTDRGHLRPVRVRKNINAMLDMEAFGGGVRLVGSNSATAERVFDGDPATGWAPRADVTPEEAYIEFDLGRTVTAERVRLRFAEDAPPFQFFKVLLSKGEKFFNISNVPIENTRVIHFNQSFGFNQEREIVLDVVRGSLRFVRVEVSQLETLEEGARLVEIEVETIGDNIALGLIERGGSLDLITDLEEGSSLAGADRMVDGEIVTVWNLNTLHQTVTGTDIFNRVIFDLGAHYWLDRVRILGEPFNAAPRARQRYANFFWYNILASDGSLAPDGSLLWHEIAALPSQPENTLDRRNFEHEFPLQKVRYVQHFYPSSEGGSDGENHSNFQGFGLISEYQIYGDGFPAEVRMTSPILDLQELKGMNTLDWVGDTPPGTRLEIRTRTGNEVIEETFYFDKRGKSQTKRQWERAPSTLRGPTETLINVGSDWAAWSGAYVNPGEFFKSPSPRRYVQMEVRMLSDDPAVAASLEELHLNLEDPLALETRAEIFPRQARPGTEEEFTLFIKPTFGGRSQGYDRLVVEASVDLGYMGLDIGGDAVDGEVVDTEDGFEVRLDREIRSSDLVSLTFNSTIFQNQTRFDVFLGNSRLGNQVRQRVDAGNATDEVDSQSISVGLPINRALLGNVVLAPEVLTPNGDGVGDQLSIEFDALKLVTPRPLEVVVYDLAGRRVHRILSQDALARHYSLKWDGRDSDGNLVSPGNYLVRIEVDGDSRAQTVQKIVPVVY